MGNEELRILSKKVKSKIHFKPVTADRSASGIQLPNIQITESNGVYKLNYKNKRGRQFEKSFLFLIPMYLIFKQTKSQTKGREANAQAVGTRTGNLGKA